MGKHNTMIKVDGKRVKTPSSFQWSLQDISASDAGRTQDTLMHKMRVGKKRKIVLSWNVPTKEEITAILKAFDPEYFKVTYWDPLDGAETTRTFYSGDKTAPVKTWNVNNKIYEQLSFDIIER